MSDRSKSPCLIMKFGGTSVGSSEAIRRSVEIVGDNSREWNDMVVVVSALSGVTTQLLQSAEQSAAGQEEVGRQVQHELRERHVRTARELLGEGGELDALTSEIDFLTSEFGSLCHAMYVLGETTPRALDAVASIGERLSVRIVSAALRQAGVDSIPVEATELIATDSTFQAAHPDLNETRSRVNGRLVPVMTKGTVPVVTGFLGSDPEGRTTTLGRGGSDYSAALLAAALRADEVWIWTDVDGVMTADPRIVSGARTIPSLSYLELAELAYFGAKVVHPMTIRPVIEAGIGLAIRNTFRPSHPGTRLVLRNEDSADVIKAVTSIRGQSLISIEGRGMLGVPGVAARAFSAVAATGTNVILISQASSEQSISFAVPSSRSGQVVAALESTFVDELRNRDIDRVGKSDEVVIVTVVGSGMRHTPGVAGRVFKALGDGNVNVVAIAQGSSEVAISLVVEAQDMELAVQRVHDLIGFEEES